MHTLPQLKATLEVRPLKTLLPQRGSETVHRSWIRDRVPYHRNYGDLERTLHCREP